MIVDYSLLPKHRPSDRSVWLMGKKMEEDGWEVGRKVLRALESGEIKYVDHVLYKLCRHCMDYKPLDEFYTNKRFIMDKAYICKTCSATRRRIKKYAGVGHVSDVGMVEATNYFTVNLKDKTREVLLNRLKDSNVEDEAFAEEEVEG